MNTRDIKKKLMTGWMVWKMAEGLPRDKIKQLQRDNTKLQDSITYLQSQSMRNNLIFSNSKEVANEKPGDTSNTLRTFMIKN